MPRLRIVECIPIGTSDPLPELIALMEGHSFSRIAKGTYIRINDDMEVEMWYEDSKLIVFKKDRMVVDIGERPSHSALSRLTATLSMLSMYAEHRGGGSVEGGVYICEAGGGGAVKYTPGMEILYVAPDQDEDSDEDDEKEAVRYG